MTTVATEFDAREGDLPAEVEPRQIAFELNAVAMGLNQALQLFGDRRAPARARQAVRRILHRD